ncbi:MAG: outer membrane beta-barrel protein [Nibricoccus sp.]
MKMYLHLALAAVMSGPLAASAEETASNQQQPPKIARISTRSNIKIASSDERAEQFAIYVGTGLVVGALASTGMHFTVGGGGALMRARDFSLQTDYGEVLPVTSRNATAGTFNACVGYQFNEDWGLNLAFINFEPVTARLAKPNVSAPLAGIPAPSFFRNNLRYSAMQWALMPTYTITEDDRFRVLATAGVTYSPTDAQFETEYYATYSGRPPGMSKYTTQKQKNYGWGYAAGCSAELALSKHFSLSLSAVYAPLKVKLPSSTPLAWKSAVPTKSSVNVDTLNFALTFTARR